MWEYKIVDLRKPMAGKSEAILEQLSALGQERWELVSITEAWDENGVQFERAYLKRHNSSSPEAL